MFNRRLKISSEIEFFSIFGLALGAVVRELLFPECQQMVRQTIAGNKICMFRRGLDMGAEDRRIVQKSAGETPLAGSRIGAIPRVLVFQV